MKKHIFNKYPENLQSEYNSSITTLKNVFDGNEIEKWNQEIKEMKVKEGVDSDGAKLAKFIIAAMVMHSGIVAFFP